MRLYFAEQCYARANGAATVENSIEVGEKTKTELPCDLTALLLGLYLKKTERLI